MGQVLKLVCDDPELEKKIAEGGQPLIDLCRKTVDKFNTYLKTCGIPQWQEGLVLQEPEACAGLLYQMYRGRLHEEEAPSDLPEGPSSG